MTQPVTATRVIPSPGDAATTVVNAAVGALPGGDTVDAVRRWVGDRHNWVRVGWFGAGVVLIVAGVIVIANRATGGAVGNAAGKVIPG